MIRLKTVFFFSFAICFIPSRWLSEFMGTSSSFVIAQELNCSVQILSPQFQTSADKKIFETLQQSIFEFMNNRKWTNDVFQQDERIECSIVITVTEKPSIDIFRGNIQVQARRPVHKSSYHSLLFNYVDNTLEFKYIEYQPLEFVENSFTSNLTSLLAYYAYLVIGLDYDTFSLEGGTEFFQKAQTIVANAQNANESGWKSFEDTRNRYWIVENMLNSTFNALRECIYKYHRHGFDLMAEDAAGGRANVLAAVELLKKVHENKPGSFNLQLFFLAKADEIVNLFSLGDPAEKTKIIPLLNEIDPANAGKYNKINQSNE